SLHAAGQHSRLQLGVGLRVGCHLRARAREAGEPRRLRLWPLYQLHAGRSGGLVRHHDRFHLNTSLYQSPLRRNGGRCLRVLRTLMIVLPLIRSVGLKAATASSRVATLPMFVRTRPSRARRTISLSWARSGTTTKSIAKPSAGRASVGPAMVTSVPPA